MNTISLIIWGSMLEAFLGWWRFVILYFLSGLVGSLFSFLLSAANTISCGASGCIIGLSGGILGILIINWNALDRYPETKMLLCRVVVLVTFLSVLFSFGGTIVGGS